MQLAVKDLAIRQLWRSLESPLLRRVVGESTIDFYGRMVSPGVTSRRVFARVEQIRREAHGVKSFVLAPNGHFKGFRAGQHVNTFVEVEGVRRVRTYSPSNAPDGSRQVVLTVKRHPGGLVSGFLHDHVHVGQWLELGQPFGDFTLSPDGPASVLLIAGGSGITPIASLVRALAREGNRDLRVLAYGRTYAELIFAEELRALAREHLRLRVHFAVTRESSLGSDLRGHFGPEHLDQVTDDPSAHQTFVCGPPSLIASVSALWTERGFSHQPKTETFTPLAFPGPKHHGGQTSVEVTARDAGKKFAATSGVSLLVQAEKAGLFPPSGCRRGICFSCTCHKRIGTVRDLATGAVSSEPNEQIRLCVSEPLTDVTLDL